MTDFEVEIEKIVAGGDGLGHHEGRVVFVPGTAPGERHRVRALR
ncbi:MAG TPA: TRAM domain-containing protein, partial [Vicinamibacteria bacterium]